MLSAKRISTEQIVAKPREAEKLHGQEKRTTQVSKRSQISDQNCYRWRLKYGALKEDEAQCLNALELDNARLKLLGLLHS